MIRQEALGCRSIAPLLDEDVEHDAVLVDGSPESVAFAADLQLHVVQMPLVRRVLDVGVDRPRRWPELGALLSDGLFTLGKQVLHIAEAEAEAKVQPHGVGEPQRSLL